MLQEAGTEAVLEGRKTRRGSARKDAERILIRIPRSSKRASAEDVDQNAAPGGEPPAKVASTDGNRRMDGDWCALSPGAGQSDSVNCTFGADDRAKALSAGQAGLDGAASKSAPGANKPPPLSSSLSTAGPRDAPSPSARATPVRFPEKEGSIAVAIEYVPVGPVGRATQLWLSSVDYEPFKMLFEQGDDVIGAMFSVRVPAALLDDRSLVSRLALWGGADGTYTDDSDVVCILKHTGYRPRTPSSHIKVTLRVAARESSYPSVELNGTKSRSWSNHSGLSMQFIGARECDGGPRAKRRASLPQCGCIIKFNSASEPLLDYADLLLQADAVQAKLNSTALQLEGTNATYTLSKTADGLHTVTKEEPTGSIALFTDLEWREVGWRQSGLAIRSTFVNIHGYRWADL